MMPMFGIAATCVFPCTLAHPHAQRRESANAGSRWIDSSTLWPLKRTAALLLTSCWMIVSPPCVAMLLYILILDFLLLSRLAYDLSCLYPWLWPQVVLLTLLLPDYLCMTLACATDSTAAWLSKYDLGLFLKTSSAPDWSPVHDHWPGSWSCFLSCPAAKYASNFSGTPAQKCILLVPTII